METNKFKIIYINHSDIDSREEGISEIRNTLLVDPSFKSKFEIFEQFCTFSDYDHSESFSAKLNPVTEEDNVSFSAKPAEYGRFLSHFFLWNQLYKSDEEFYIIAENYHSVTDLFGLLNSPIKIESDYIDLASIYHEGSVCYILNKSGAEKLINNMPESNTIPCILPKYIENCKDKRVNHPISHKRFTAVKKTENFFFKSSEKLGREEEAAIIKSPQYKFWEKPGDRLKKEFTNKLLLLILTTEAEIKDGRLYKLFSRYFASTISDKHSIDVIIYTNKEIIDEKTKYFQYHKNINSICFFSAEIDPKEDVYIIPGKGQIEFKKENNYVPILGFSSGPNKLFFEAMLNILEGKHGDYKNILMLETDTRNIKEKWLDPFVEYCDNDFTIAGSRPKGRLSPLGSIQPWSGHLNGVALYKTGTKLKYLLDGALRLISESVRSGNQEFLSFDVAIHSFAQSAVGFPIFYPDEEPNQLKDIKLISNLSQVNDAKLPLYFLKANYAETIIVHQKIG